MKTLILILIFLFSITGCDFDMQQMNLNQQNNNKENKEIDKEVIREEKQEEQEVIIKKVKSGTNIGEKALDFMLEDIDGEKYSLEKFKGKKIILNFWATWCPYCMDEMPYFEKYYENENLEILTINLIRTEKLSRKEVEEFMKEKGFNFRVLYDINNVVTKKYKAFNLPTTYFINEKGIIENIKVGAVEEKEITNFINKGESTSSQDNLSKTHKNNMIIKLYYLNKNKYLNNNIKSLDVVEEEIRVSENDNIEEIILKKLFEGPKDNSKYIDVIPEESSVNEVYLDKEKIMTVDLSKEFKENQEFGSDAEIYAVYSIVNTLTELDYVDKIKLLIDGEEVENLKHVSVEDFYERDSAYLNKND